MSDGNMMAWHQRHVLGWRVDVLLAVLLGIALLGWGAWLTREVMALQERRIVSVSLQSLIEDYVSATARQGLSEDEAARRTKAYLAAVEAAVARLNDGRTTVLVSEAVVGQTVPDVTGTVEAAIAQARTAGGERDVR